jgi:hypothetical protein
MKLNKDEGKEGVIQYSIAVVLVHVTVVFPLLEPIIDIATDIHVDAETTANVNNNFMERREKKRRGRGE